MYKIDEVRKTISITRGDALTIPIRIKTSSDPITYHTFSVGDVIDFSVYGKKKLNEPPVIQKSVEVTEETDTVYILLDPSDTRIGDCLNVPVEYWYEIELNNIQTILGYDESGAKLFILYPEGSVN